MKKQICSGLMTGLWLDERAQWVNKRPQWADERPQGVKARAMQAWMSQFI